MSDSSAPPLLSAAIETWVRRSEKPMEAVGGLLGVVSKSLIMGPVTAAIGDDGEEKQEAYTSSAECMFLLYCALGRQPREKWLDYVVRAGYWWDSQRPGLEPSLSTAAPHTDEDFMDESRRFLRLGGAHGELGGLIAGLCVTLGWEPRGTGYEWVPGASDSDWVHILPRNWHWSNADNLSFVKCKGPCEVPGCTSEGAVAERLRKKHVELLAELRRATLDALEQEAPKPRFMVIKQAKGWAYNQHYPWSPECGDIRQLLKISDQGRAEVLKRPSVRAVEDYVLAHRAISGFDSKEWNKSIMNDCIDTLDELSDAGGQASAVAVPAEEPALVPAAPEPGSPASVEDPAESPIIIP